MEFETDNNRIASMMQVISHSLLDVNISKNAIGDEKSFNRDYKQYHAFQFENLEHYHNAENFVEFGKKFKFSIPKLSDLMGDIYLKVKLPSIITHPGFFKQYYVNSIGHALIKEVIIKHGSDTIYSSTGELLEIISKYNTSYTKIKAKNEMIGTFHTEYSLVDNSNQDRTYYINIPLWKTYKTRNYFPMMHGLSVADPIDIYIEFRNLSEIVSSELTKDDQLVLNDVTVQIFENECKTGVQVYIGITDQEFVETSRGDNKFEASLLIDHIYLTQEERMLFLSKDLEYIIEQSVYEDYTLDVNGQSKMILNFKNPVKELIIIAFPHLDDNKKVNFKYHKLDSFEFYFNGQKRDNSKQSGTDANQYLKMQNHLGIPNQYIYSYSFCLMPDDLQPTGTFNFSENKNNFVIVKAKTNIKLTVRIYAIYYNMYEINQQGFGRLRYN